MNLSDVMHRDVELIDEKATICEAAQRMSELDVGSLPVRRDDRVTGLVTDRDLVLRSLARGDDPKSTPVSSVMTKKIEWCFADESIEEASRKMSERQIQRLIVLDRNKRLVGIVSLADLVRCHEAEQTVQHAIEEIKSPTKSTAIGTRAQSGPQPSHP